MKEADLDRLTEKLYSFIDRGPGADADALREVKGVIAEIQRIYPDDVYVREKALQVGESFAVWFSARRWKGKDDGVQCRTNLYRDIPGLPGAVQTHVARMKIIAN